MEYVNGDCIQFDSRVEIDEVQSALMVSLKGKDAQKYKDSVEKMLSLMDLMYMNW